MKTRIFTALAFLLLSEMIHAQELPKCEIKIRSKPIPDSCFRWKTSSGDPSDVAAMEKPHLGTFQLPNGKIFTLPVKHNYLSAAKDSITHADFFVSQEDLTYSDAVDFMIETWKKIGLYEALSNESLKAIDKMKGQHGGVFYPDLELGNTNISSTVKTLIPSKDKDENAKIWHVRFRISDRNSTDRR